MFHYAEGATTLWATNKVVASGVAFGNISCNVAPKIVYSYTEDFPVRGSLKVVVRVL